jgi:hypothetical protein
LVIDQLQLERTSQKASEQDQKATVANRMVSAGATCLSSSAVSLPPPHCQTIPSKYPAPKSAMAMSAAMVDELRERLLLIVKNVRLN